MTFATLNSREEASKISSAAVEDLRQKILEVINKSPELYYEKDIEKIKSNDWWIRRFLNHNKLNAEKALESLDKSLKWRKSFGVLEINDTEFPKEAYLAAPLILYGKDLNGAQLLILRSKVARKIKVWVPMAQRYFVNLVEKAEQSDVGKGVTLFVDCKGSGLRNADTDFMKFAHTVLNDYYPGLVNAGLVYKLPKVLEAVFKIVRSWLNEEQEKYCYLIGKKNINEYVAINELPDFLLGLNKQEYRKAPEGAPTTHELAEKLGIKVEKADKLVKQLEQFYTE